MQITLNGETRELPEGCTVADMLAQLGLGERPVAVERNTEIVPRATHPEARLSEGDVVEIVQFVGGG